MDQLAITRNQYNGTDQPLLIDGLLNNALDTFA